MTLFVLQFFPNFLLIFCRITAFFVVAPLFASRAVPLKLKIGLSFFLTLATFSMLGMTEPIPIDNAYFLAIIREVLVGLILAYVCFLFFAAVQVAGSFIDFQIGFALANVIDPLTGTMAPLFGNFKYYLAILLFLSFNAHHFLIKGIMDSYEWVPLSGNLFTQVASGSIGEFLVTSFVSMFQIAFQMAAPFVVAIFVMEVVLGIMAKSMPQLNIFIVGIPLKIMLGLVIFIILAPGLIYLLQDLFATMFEAMYAMMKLMQ